MHSLYRIANIIVGKKDEVLSPLLNGNGMDLDNIDNVIRASSAMGIIGSKDMKLPIQLAESFMFDENNKICHNGLYLNEIKRWQQIRDDQYTAIFESVDDFAYQTMIKKALSLMIKEDTKHRMSKDSWKLTDSSILYDFLLKNEKCKQIMTRVQLCKPYCCLGVLYVQGSGSSRFINTNLTNIESVVSKYFMEVLGLKETDEKVNELSTGVVVANFYPDKRKRAINTDAIFMGTKMSIDEPDSNRQDGALLGLFTPLYNSNHITTKDENDKPIRKTVSFKQEHLDKLIKILKNQVFNDFDISIYERGHK